MLCTQGRLKLNFICSDFREPCYMTRDSQFGFWTQMCSGIWTKREYLLLVGSIKVWPDWWSASYLNIQWVLNSFKDKQVYLNILIYNFILEKKKNTKKPQAKKKKPKQNPATECILQAISLDKTRGVSILSICTNTHKNILCVCLRENNFLENFLIFHSLHSDFCLQLSSFTQHKAAFEISMTPELYLFFLPSPFPPPQMW